MKEKLVQYVELFFNDIPYSKESLHAKEQIISKLVDLYSESISIHSVVEEYNSLYKLANLVGYTESDVKKWCSKKDLVTQELLFKEFKRERRLSYLIVFFYIFSFIYLYNIVIRPHIIYVFFALLLGSLGLYLSFKRKSKIFKDKRYSLDCYVYLQKLHDKYGKKLINSIFFGFGFFGLLILTMIQLKSNSKIIEIFEIIDINLLYIELILLFIGKNFLLVDWIDQKLKSNETKTFKNNLKRVLLFSFLFWFISILINNIIFNQVTNLFFIELLIYSVAYFVYIFKFRKTVTYQNVVINQKRIVITTFIIVLFTAYGFMRREVWLVQPYINSVPNIRVEDHKIEYDEQSGVYTITKTKDDFKILQLTDIHLGGSITSYSKDMKALQVVYKLIDSTRPDFVVVTGDLTFPMGIMSFSFDNYTPVMQFASFMRNLGIPWAFTYGNHDTESVAIASKEDLNSLYMSLSYKTSKNLLYPYVQPSITGRSNQLIELRNRDGSLDQALFLIDSNAYTGEGINKYDFIHEDQVDWYKSNVLRLSEEEGKTISSLVFFHIPLQQYETAYQLYEQGSSEVTYYFGSNDEKMIDKVCASDYPSNMFDVAVELGSTKGFFCGHDHYNNMSLEYRGIRLTYGMSIDYLAMPGIERDTKQRGATLITTHKDSSIDIEQIPLSEVEKLYSSGSKLQK